MLLSIYRTTRQASLVSSAKYHHVSSTLTILPPSQRFITSTTKCQAKGNSSLASLLGIIKQKRTSIPSFRQIGSHDKVLYKLITKFPKDSAARKKARGMGISSKLFADVSEGFVKQVLLENVPRLNPRMVKKIMNEEGVEGVQRLIMSSFYEYAEPHMPQEVLREYNSLRKLSDMRFPSEWFPEARQMQRKIILHVGPTNSGKTYRAIQRLQSAESGIYCGPLRLLAHEIYDKMNQQGIACNLLTGEERRVVSPTAALTSSTVEMANFTKPLEVAVIDEIQLIGDPYRGWAWTQALLGLKAKEIHLCGEPAAVPLIKKICESLGEQVIVNEYERLTPVAMATESLNGNLKNVQKGDCVVAFSRSNIFKIKQDIEKATGLQCAVAYGGLPPETRALQAKSFNDPNSPANVLVASDAVGMGLNLNIKRVVFSTVMKFDGRHTKHMQIPQLKQIAGRAGRFGTAYASGEVTTLYEKDMQYVETCLAEPNISLELAGLQPTVDIVELFALQMPNEKYSSVLQRFEDLASLDGNYFLCNFNDQKLIADKIEAIKLPLRDRYQFVTAPVSTRNDSTMDMVYHMAKTHSENGILTLPDVVQLPADAPTTTESLNTLENSHKKIMMYMWLSLRFPDTFVTMQEESAELKQRCEQLIDQTLSESSLVGKHKKRGQNRKKYVPRKALQNKQQSSG